MRSRVLAACTLSLLLALTAACTKSDVGDGVASVGGSATPSATQNLSIQEQGIRHARCMREHGVPEPDPQVLPDGTVRVGGPYDKKGSIGALSAAKQACRPYEIVLSGPDGQRKLESAREYSRCMRAHGVPDFPDPDANGRIELPPDQNDPDYEQARTFCRAQPPSSPSPRTTR